MGTGPNDPHYDDQGNWLSYPDWLNYVHQRVRNESWPFRDAKGRHARGIPTQPVERIIPVQVRLVFERDGETWLEGHADRWTKTHVHVSLADDRLIVNGIWVKAEDVRRLNP